MIQIQHFFPCLSALSLGVFPSDGPVRVKVVVVKNGKNRVFSFKLHDLSNVLIEV